VSQIVLYVFESLVQNGERFKGQNGECKISVKYEGSFASSNRVGTLNTWASWSLIVPIVLNARVLQNDPQRRPFHLSCVGGYSGLTTACLKIHRELKNQDYLLRGTSLFDFREVFYLALRDCTLSTVHGARSGTEKSEFAPRPSISSADVASVEASDIAINYKRKTSELDLYISNR
jgi:hypothetical protein